MPLLKYKVELTDEEKATLNDKVKKGKASAMEIRRSNILLLTDDKRQPKLTMAEISSILGVSTNTIQTARREYCELGLKAAVERKKRETPPVKPKITGEIEAKTIALSCTEPPEGYKKWTIRLLADKVAELGYIDSISRTSVNTILKKTK